LCQEYAKKPGFCSLRKVDFRKCQVEKEISSKFRQIWFETSCIILITVSSLVLDKELAERPNVVQTGFLAEQVPTCLRVLIADDVQETRRSTRLMLAMNPEVEVVAIARNGNEAVELAKEHDPDIVILDINMPGMDGISAFKAMQKTIPEVSCIIISAEKENSTLRQAMAAGAREYLIKPFTVDELNLAVHKVSQIILTKRTEEARMTMVRDQREAYMKRLAHEYAKTRRADDQAIEVFEHLATNPNCEIRWLKVLAMIYVIRQKWDKLKVLADRLHYHPEAQENPE
jgi:YesN/AraC family two-component response regulator